MLDVFYVCICMYVCVWRAAAVPIIFSTNYITCATKITKSIEAILTFQCKDLILCVL